MSTLRLHICHSWVDSQYSKFYFDLIGSLKSDEYQIEIVSDLKHHIEPPYGTPEGLSALFNAFRKQIAKADIVILPAYMLAWRKYWAKPQIDMAQYEFSLPVWSVQKFAENPCEALSRSNKFLQPDHSAIDDACLEFLKNRSDGGNGNV